MLLFDTFTKVKDTKEGAVFYIPNRKEIRYVGSGT